MRKSCMYVPPSPCIMHACHFQGRCVSKYMHVPVSNLRTFWSMCVDAMILHPKIVSRVHPIVLRNFQLTRQKNVCLQHIRLYQWNAISFQRYQGLNEIRVTCQHVIELSTSLSHIRNHKKLITEHNKDHNRGRHVNSRVFHGNVSTINYQYKKE